jgi:NADH:ubiquinone oxidoreductase subunit 6 (subunit J)
MRKLVQCPNCISYKVILLKRLHYSIFLAVSATIALYCIWFLLTDRDSGVMEITIVGGAMLFTILTIVLTVKLTGPKKADVLCTRCGFRFKTSKY